MKYIGNVQSQANAEVFAVASGALPDGKPVIVNSNGTVSVVAQTSISDSAGTPATASSQNVTGTQVTYDSSANRIVGVYADAGDSSAGYAVVGTVTGTNISWGTPVEFASQAGETDFSCAYDSTNEKVVVVYKNGANSNYGTALVGTVSGTSISFGSTTVYNSGNTGYSKVAFGNGKIVVVYKDVSASNYGRIIVGAVSGTSISFGSEGSLNNSETNNLQITYSTGLVFGAFYREYGKASVRVCTLASNGTNSITVGAETTLSSSGNTYIQGDASYDTVNQKFVIIYSDGTNSGYQTASVGTVVYNGTDATMTFGTKVVVYSAESYQGHSVYYVSVGKHVVTDNTGYFKFGTVSGTSISFGNTIQFNSAAGANPDVAYDSSSEKVIIFFRSYATSDRKPTGVVVQAATEVTNLTTENFLGFTGGEVTFVNQVVGSGTVFESAATSYTSTTFDSNSNRVVVAYRDGGNSNRGTAVVGTVSGTSVSFGTPVVFNSGETVYVSATFDSNSNKVVVAYRDQGNSSYGTAVVGTVDSSNNSISFGSETVFETAQTNYISTTFDSNLNKVVISYIDAGDSDKGKSIVGTVSGTSISFGTAVQFEAGETSLIFSSFDNNSNKVVTSFKDKSDSNIGKSIVGTVSGTSISFGTAVAFNTAAPDEIRSSFDTFSNKTVVAYKRTGGDGTYLSSIVGTVSGTSISFGAESVVREGGTAAPSVAYDASANRSVVFYKDSSNSNYGTFRVGTISGTSITYDTAVVFLSGNIEDLSSTYEANSEKVVVSGNNQSNSQYGTSVVLQTGATTRGEIADGKTATIQVGGSINTQQNALTAGQQYFVQTDGTIGTTAASPSVLAGTAVSATDLIVKG